ncbi:hypothetical protein [Thiomicrorhabdus sediminis]|uniref:DUF72 domain-containing protein n=1 Tax=Thiomicrorhabdus sediminis TaxID=2580412 RepID=A0A4P9K3V6_9GAMM|nr:hypothetical protein [Thiomicrorhabdus sediminis]QCU89614.1 hypothetical protein FE785_02665 [Thiomicrorhabdus sediminis]
MEFENIQIGTLGWQHESWQGGFYPEDMPEDWQLDFYANQFHCLLVPEPTWLAWTDDDLADVLQSLPEKFALYLQVVSEVDDSKLRQIKMIKAKLASLLAGLVVFSEFGDIANHYAAIPVTLVSKKHELCGWNWSAENDYVCSGAVCGVLPALSEDAKQQAELIKSFMSSIPKDALGAPFIVCAGASAKEDVNIEQVANLKTIAELLGY